jgi:pilus assembly protein CpaB
MSEPRVTVRGAVDDPEVRRSSVGAVLFTSVAALLAVATAWMCWRMLTAGGYANEPTRPVVVAARQIEAGHPLTPGDLKVVAWPVSSMMPGVFHATDKLLAPEPRVPTIGLLPGEAILAARLASPDAGPGLASLVGAQTRAVAIKLDHEVAAAHLLYPGARVDVLATLQGRDRSVATRIIIDNARVLAVGSFADVVAVRRGVNDGERGQLSALGGGGDVAAVVTVEVSPGDAERLTLAAREGKIDLALRNAGDRAGASTRGVSSGELLAGNNEEPAPASPASPAAPKKRAPRPKKVKVVYDEASAPTER